MLKPKIEPAVWNDLGDGHPISNTLEYVNGVESVKKINKEDDSEFSTTVTDYTVSSKTAQIPTNNDSSEMFSLGTPNKLISQAVNSPGQSPDLKIQRSMSHDCKVRLLRVGKEQYIVKRDDDNQCDPYNDETVKSSRHVEELPTSADEPENSRSPTLASDIDVADLTDNTLIICPLCPKQLLCRLLPVHMKFHNNSCRYQCTKCSFSSSFKLVASPCVLF